MLVMLGARHLDQRGELAVGLRMGPANPLQPGRSVVGVAQGDQSDEQLHHPRRVGLDRRRAELVQPQADRPHGEVRLLQRARRTTERGPHDPARTIRVGHRHGLLQRADVIPTILEGRTRPIVRRPEPRGARRCQPRPEKRREQVVVAVPAPPLIQGHDEQVGGDEVVEQCRRLFDARDGSAQLGIEDVEHRRLDEELDERRVAGRPAARSPGSR